MKHNNGLTLIEDSGFRLPIASAIATVLYPEKISLSTTFAFVTCSENFTA